jgi:hypothetical protein
MLISIHQLLHSTSMRHARITRHGAQHSNAIVASIIVALLLYGCGGKVNVQHSQLQTTAEDEHVAKVYFLRPMPLKYKGIADKKVRIDFQNQPLLTIKEGQYTLVKLKPSKGEVVTHSTTKFTNDNVPINVSRAREYRFIAGKTYFIHVKRVDEEFRGIFYDPAPVNLEQALELSRRLHAVGLAADEPIDQIKSIAEAPEPSPLEPALPENLYPGKKYLIKGNPKYEAESPPPPPPADKNEITFDQPPQDSGDISK